MRNRSGRVPYQYCRHVQPTREHISGHEARQCSTTMQSSVLALALLAGTALALPTLQDPSLWKGTAMDSVVKDLESSCTQKNDGISCIKFKVLNLIDQALMRDNIQVRRLDGSIILGIFLNAYQINKSRLIK